MSYKIGSDGVVTAELDRLLQSIETRVSGLGIHAQTSGTGAVASGSVTAESVKAPHVQPPPAHDWLVILIAILGGAVAGYFAGKSGAQRVLFSVKAPHV